MACEGWHCSLLTLQQSNYNRTMSVANSAKQQSSSASSLQGFNKIKPTGFNMGSMDAINNALNMGSSEQLALPDVENDFDLQNLKASQDQLSSSPLTSATGSANTNSTGVKFEQKKVTSSQKTKVSYTSSCTCLSIIPCTLGWWGSAHLQWDT